MHPLVQVVVEGHAANLTHTIVLQVLRWAHFFFGIAWLGHLFFFNFVGANAEPALSADVKKVVAPNIRGRALWWFRQGAMGTFLTGWGYLVYEQVSAGTNFAGWLSFGPDGAGFKNGWILFGGILGTIMWFNVWFVIWPRQSRIIPVLAGTAPKPENFDALVAVAAKVSKINFYLAVPLLFTMGARHHFPVARTGGELLLWQLGVLVVGVGIAVHVLQIARRVGKEFVPPVA